MRPIVSALAALGLLSACGSESGESADQPTLDVGADALDASDTPDVDTSFADADTVDIGAVDSVIGDVDLTPRALSTCDGNATVLVAGAPGDDGQLRRLAGDAQVRGFVERCDGSTQVVRLRQTCGGTVNLTLGGAASATFEARVRVPEVAEAEELSLATDGTATGSLELATWVDADASGDFAIEVELSCSGRGGATWSLHVDGPSSRGVPTSANGYPSAIPLSGDDGDRCVLGQTPPAIDGLVDRHGESVSLTQFHGEMLVMEFGMMWCIPCQRFASRAANIETRAEAASNEYGVSVISILAGDYDGYQTTARQIADWSRRYGVSSGVFGGQGAYELTEQCDVRLYPSLYILDPHMVIRGALSGSESDEEILERVDRAWHSFRADHPEWVSPRCSGVLDDGDGCACIDDAVSGDSDADEVPDACDWCVGADDRSRNPITGLPQRCVPPGTAHRYPTRIEHYVEFGYESEGQTAPAFSVPDSEIEYLPLIQVGLFDDEDFICSISRKAHTVPLPTGFETGPFEAIAALELNAGNSHISHTCTNLLDPALWGADLNTTFEAINWGFAVLERCSKAGCEGASDDVWSNLRGWMNSGEDCDPWARGCADAMMGGAPWFSSVGLIGDLELTYAITWALRVSDTWRLTRSRQWIPSSEVFEGVDRTVFVGDGAIRTTAAEIVEMLAGIEI